MLMYLGVGVMMLTYSQIILQRKAKVYIYVWVHVCIIKYTHI